MTFEKNVGKQFKPGRAETVLIGQSRARWRECFWKSSFGRRIPHYMPFPRSKRKPKVKNWESSSSRRNDTGRAAKSLQWPHLHRDNCTALENSCWSNCPPFYTLNCSTDPSLLHILAQLHVRENHWHAGICVLTCLNVLLMKTLETKNYRTRSIKNKINHNHFKRGRRTIVAFGRKSANQFFSLWLSYRDIRNMPAYLQSESLAVTVVQF